MFRVEPYLSYEKVQNPNRGHREVAVIAPDIVINQIKPILSSAKIHVHNLLSDVTELLADRETHLVIQHALLRTQDIV